MGNTIHALYTIVLRTSGLYVLAVALAFIVGIPEAAERGVSLLMPLVMLALIAYPALATARICRSPRIVAKPDRLADLLVLVPFFLLLTVLYAVFIHLALTTIDLQFGSQDPEQTARQAADFAMFHVQILLVLAAVLCLLPNRERARRPGGAVAAA